MNAWKLAVCVFLSPTISRIWLNLVSEKILPPNGQHMMMWSAFTVKADMSHTRGGNFWVVATVKSCVEQESWLNKSEQPIRSQVSKLTQLLTLSQTHKFPSAAEDCLPQGGLHPGGLWEAALRPHWLPRVRVWVETRVQGGERSHGAGAALLQWRVLESPFWILKLFFVVVTLFTLYVWQFYVMN